MAIVSIETSFLLLCFNLMLGNVHLQPLTVHSGCVDVPPTTIQVIKGSSFRGDCTLLSDHLPTPSLLPVLPMGPSLPGPPPLPNAPPPPITDPQSVDIECVVRNPIGDVIHSYNGTISHNGATLNADPYVIDTVASGLNLSFTVQSSEGCASTLYIIKVVDLVTGTCQEGASTKIIERIENCDSNVLTLACELTETDPPVFIAPDQLNVTWYRNCEVIPRDVTHTQLDRSNFRKNSRLLSTFEMFSYIDFAANYSCAVRVNGIERFINYFKICVKRSPTVFQSPVLTSTATSVTTRLHNDVTLSCKGLAPPSSGNLIFYWEKILVNGTRELLCVHRGNVGSATNNICTLGITNSTQHMCSNGGHFTTPNCTGFANEKFTTTLRLTNVQIEDLVIYTCHVENSLDDKAANVSLSLAPYTPPVDQLTIALVVVAGMVVGGVLCFLAVRYFQTDIRSIWKKYFASYERTYKEHGAFFSYSFDQNATNNPSVYRIRKLHEWFAAHSYEVYDHYKEGSGESRYVGAKQHIQMSHRVVIFLTNEYLEDSDNMFHAQAAILENILSDAIIIFVVTPELSEAVLREPQHRAIQMAMKQHRNRVIHWKGNDLESHHNFFKKLETAMPKLRPQSAVLQNANVRV